MQMSIRGAALGLAHLGAVLALAGGGAGCALHPVLGPQHAELAEARVEISQGDRLRVLTRDGRRRMVTIEGANEAALITTRGESIAIKDLVFVEEERFSGGHAAAGVGAAALLVLVATAATAGGYAAILATPVAVP